MDAPVAWAAVWVLSTVGLLDSLYFALVAYRLMRPDARWMPPVCRMDEASCARIVDTRYGRLLGLPNGVYGLAWYGFLVAYAGRGWKTPSPPGCELVWVASLAVLAVSLFLAWALLARLRVACRLCFLAHGVNLANAFLLGWLCLTPSV